MLSDANNIIMKLFMEESYNEQLNCMYKNAWFPFVILTLLWSFSSCSPRKHVRQIARSADTGAISYFALSDTSMVAHRNGNEDEEMGYFLKRDGVFLKKGKVLIFPYCNCSVRELKGKTILFPDERHLKGKTNMRIFESVDGSLTMQKNEVVISLSIMGHDTVEVGTQDISLINDCKDGNFWCFGFYGPGDRSKAGIKLEDTLMLHIHDIPSKEGNLCRQYYTELHDRKELIRRYFQRKSIRL